MRKPIAADFEKLAGFKIFRGFTADELSTLLPKLGLEVRKYRKGQVIFTDGEDPNKVLMLTKGIVNFYDSSRRKGKRLLVRAFEEGDVLGLSIVMKASELNVCKVIAQTETEMVMLSGPKFRDYLYKQGYKRLFENVMECFGDYIRFSRQKFTLLRQKKAEERLLLYLRYRAEKCGPGELTMPYPRMEDGAEFLGITRTALSLAIKQLVKEGLIQHPRRACFILNG